LPEEEPNEHPPWDPRALYVVGHQRPDTDAIAAALGYAWYLLATGEQSVVAARAGHTGAQTQFALQRFGVPPPRILTAVAPTFGHAARPHAALAAAAPLSQAIAHLAAGVRILPVLETAEQPLGVVTPIALARAHAAEGGLAAALARPCREVLEAAPSFGARERISDHRAALLRSDADDFLVIDETGRYIGVATRARLLDPPRARLILVDHNELSQAVAGAEEAEIVAVLDHHRLGNAPTPTPIPFVVDPVGSTCTLVAERCRDAGLTPPADLAGVTLSGILSDTLLFRSPTTTERDRTAAAWLAEIAAVELDRYGEELLRAAPGLAARDAGEILEADRKVYEIGGRRLSIAQVEVAGIQELPHRRDDLLAALAEQRRREPLALACLMVTDVVAGQSRLLCQGETRILAALPFPRVGPHEWDLGPIVSRKKQLVPALHAVLEE
jgi:manganese-dependent inorganic pyrophosphatase